MLYDLLIKPFRVRPYKIHRIFFLKLFHYRSTEPFAFYEKFIQGTLFKIESCSKG